MAVALAKKKGLKNVMIANPKKLPFRNGEFIFCLGQGILEHMSYTDAIFVLKETRRVSKYSGFSVPLRYGILHMLQKSLL